MNEYKKNNGLKIFGYVLAFIGLAVAIVIGYFNKNGFISNNEATKWLSLLTGFVCVFCLFYSVIKKEACIRGTTIKKNEHPLIYYTITSLWLLAAMIFFVLFFIN